MLYTSFFGIVFQSVRASPYVGGSCEFETLTYHLLAEQQSQFIVLETMNCPKHINTPSSISMFYKLVSSPIGMYY